MTAPLNRAVMLPEPVATLIETWIQNKHTGYIQLKGDGNGQHVQLNFGSGGLASATVHLTVPVKTVSPT